MGNAVSSEGTSSCSSRQRTEQKGDSEKANRRGSGNVRKKHELAGTPNGMAPKCRENKKNVLEFLKTKNRAKRYKPSKCLLRNCTFSVNYKINNTFIPLLLELKNEPQCKIVIVGERRNTIIKEILIKDIQVIESSINTIDIFLKVNDEYTEDNKFTLCTFELKNNEEKAAFIHNIKMLYGLDVVEYGTIKYNKINTEEIEEKYIYDNNILSNENKSNIQSLLDDINNNLYRNRDLSEEGLILDRKKLKQLEKETLHLGEVHNPIIILGDMEDGDVIKVRELNSMQKGDLKKKENLSYDDFTLIEWFLSKNIGSHTDFREHPIHCGSHFLIKSYMIGYFVKVKVSKNVYMNGKKTFVTSVSVKGPITMNDKTAKEVLRHLSNVSESIEVYLAPSDIYNIFFSTMQPRVKKLLGLFIFYPAHIFIMRKGLRFAITLNGESYSVDYLWDSFYLTKKDILFDKPEHFVPTYMDTSDIHLYFITTSLHGEKIKSVIRTNSSDEKDVIYATVFFCKYQKGLQSLDEFMRDALAGLYSNFKKKFQNMFVQLKGENLQQIRLVSVYK
ncbi:conserved Plasmodium protein, unknown function [Plasmodium knowlesi strain H]|uniref:Uncharacterized protein n=3 Tax=Plasmodium knowlesi TaxID=5850 RepID=A0A1A7VD14_PLAKH|nr:conserved protein, unknown function [Plasmodium knowlesi strain H]OTN67814.1 Uncharacterized protein PKNOH_S05386800 [Plasmodium knowlesi]CAA9990455.1 conserved protein, unknown function [Plasmodium knowlesi strain H]SBO19661.1 conserved Plasmodium protein, unknown function [Plasmodium knowlesi strain H]SBO22512.1 conserved Plasmodium protein, unknown function [Plasmodium knowlesi strain H]VVS79929.1 conserved protein, unknown function [Plasmodium knowlesi strain H]